MLASDSCSAFGGLLVGLLRAIIRQMTFFTTTEALARGAKGTSLHGSVVRHSLV